MANQTVAHSFTQRDAKADEQEVSGQGGGGGAEAMVARRIQLSRRCARLRRILPSAATCSMEERQLGSKGGGQGELKWGPTGKLTGHTHSVEGHIGGAVIHAPAPRGR